MKKFFLSKSFYKTMGWCGGSRIYDIKIFYLIAYNSCLFTHQKVAKFAHDGEPVWTRKPFGDYVKGLSVFRTNTYIA
jgi:hypothetical protein